jgi:hypothetical protein
VAPSPAHLVGLSRPVCSEPHSVAPRWGQAGVTRFLDVEPGPVTSSARGVGRRSSRRGAVGVTNRPPNARSQLPQLPKDSLCRLH